MEYQALYRKYRPQRFDEVVGQEHVTQTLAREVVDDRIAHAYLFAGPRGTGKTTSARLLAKALNCANRGDDGEPCNECASCEGITAGNSLDVIELDAASHNKVEDVREIRVNVGTVAASAGSRRVYILDEAHMLSRAASNALLKTLEEPPGHVVFVLATTEPYKLLDTIRSRSQRFDFHPVAADRLIRHLDDIAGRESIVTDDAALAMVANHANGSVRDSMSLLEQVAALGNGEVHTDIVTRALGLADRDAFGILVDAIVNGNAPAALTLVANLASRGTDLRRFLSEAVEYFRGVFLAQYAPNLEEIVDETADVLEEWRRQSKIIGSSDVLRTIDALADALLELRQGREERLVIELALLRLTHPETTPDVEALSSRMERIESRMRTLERNQATGQTAPSAVPAPEPVAPSVPSTTPRPAVTATESAPVEAEPAAAATPTPATAPADARPAPPPAADTDAPFAAKPKPEPEAPAPTTTAVPVDVDGSVDLAAFEAVWPALVSRTRDSAGPVRHALVKVAVPRRMVQGTVQLEIPGHMPFHLERLAEDGELIATMVDLATELLGSRIGIAFVSGDDTGTSATATPDEPSRAPDKDDLVEDDDVESPEDLIADMLGGEVVSD